jgi:hypothetical protein
MLCKNLRSEVHGRTVLLAWVPDRHRVGVFGLCVFSIPRVFYHCPTTSATPVLKNTCRPGQKFFQNQNQYRPCWDHNAVPATPDCVHRVTCAVCCVLCCRPCPGCATLLVLCHCVPCCRLYAVLILCCVLCAVCCAVWVYCCVLCAVLCAVLILSPMPEVVLGKGHTRQV